MGPTNSFSRKSIHFKRAPCLHKSTKTFTRFHTLVLPIILRHPPYKWQELISVRIASRGVPATTYRQPESNCCRRDGKHDLMEGRKQTPQLEGGGINLPQSWAIRRRKTLDTWRCLTTPGGGDPLTFLIDAFRGSTEPMSGSECSSRRVVL